LNLAVGIAVAVRAESGGVAAQDLEQARRLYDEAGAEQEASRRIGLLEQSFAARETYEAAIALGEAWLQGQDAVRARIWLDRAHALCGPGEACARALFRIGESYQLEGQRSRYGQYLKQSLEEHPTALVEAAFRALMLERGSAVVPAEQIVMALTPDSTVRSAAVPSAIDLMIQFDFDSARLTATGRAQVSELGKALRRQQAAIELVGHSDEQGTASYNRDLSVRRAESVHRFLVGEFGLDPREMTVVGRGEDEPLLSDGTEHAHAINRRVEVVRR